MAGTWNSIWSADKTVKGHLINAMGVQVGRALVARAMYRVRGFRADNGVREATATLRQDGLLLWPTFLSPDHFAQIRGEFDSALSDASRKWQALSQGPNTVSLSVLPRHAADLPATRDFFADSRLCHLLKAVEKRPLGEQSVHRTLERLEQGPDGSLLDPETELHVDTFFSCHKAWLYLTDVTTAHAPFVYVRGSHRLGPRKLLEIYRASRQHREPSFDEAAVARLGLEESIVTCPANTLVVANVAGYHRRLRGAPGAERRSLHTNVRCNPFNWRNHEFTTGQPTS